MLSECIERAKAGEPVYITDVREAFSSLEAAQRLTLSCVLELVGGAARLFEIHTPAFDDLDEEEVDFVQSYVWAEIYNVLSALGGRRMTVYVDRSNAPLLDLAEGLNATFNIDKALADRKGYGRCVNVIDRMLRAICPTGAGEPDPKFEFIVKDAAEMPPIAEAPAETAGDPAIFQKVATGLKGKAICGLDIGGTDVKVALAFDGRLRGLKEYDWFPEKYKLARELNDPICALVRLMRAQVSLEENKTLDADARAKLEKRFAEALDKDASYECILSVVEGIEATLAGAIVEIDAVGLCFPDVVVQDKIVGGEVTKTRGMRENAEIDYEEEFAKITDLDERLLELCKPGGVVKNTNDGPMAAFTAAVEIAATPQAEQVRNGVFAHTLGTELGTGWVDSSGAIPEIPLECYNSIIDLGSFGEKQFEADDVRSINNFNTGLAGTLQRYTSQSGVFRMGMKFFPEKRSDLYQELFEKGLVVEMDGREGRMLTVPTKPKDMRKAFLEHMMGLVEREQDETVNEIFRQVGVCLAITWIETQRILRPAAESRILFGRLVKRPECFRLMLEGARTRLEGLVMDVADSGMANTSLMKQLDADEHFTVAQFAQAVGAIYYANQGLQAKE